MLSPNEFAVSLLVSDENGAESREFNRKDVESLIERQLVRLERRGLDHCYVHATLQGYLFPKLSGHARASRRKAIPAVR